MACNMTGCVCFDDGERFEAERLEAKAEDIKAKIAKVEAKMRDLIEAKAASVEAKVAAAEAKIRDLKRALLHVKEMLYSDLYAEAPEIHGRGQIEDYIDEVLGIED